RRGRFTSRRGSIRSRTPRRHTGTWESTTSASSPSGCTDSAPSWVEDGSRCAGPAVRWAHGPVGAGPRVTPSPFGSSRQRAPFGQPVTDRSRSETNLDLVAAILGLLAGGVVGRDQGPLGTHPYGDDLPLGHPAGGQLLGDDSRALARELLVVSGRSTGVRVA